ncbi:MAG TPA: serine/threonine-protein kinase, partial [Actinocrinis sp.]
GGMGRVYLSFTPGGRAIAIKVVRPDYAEDPEFRARFRREVSAAQRVQGIYTASVVDADVEAPVPWLATVYVPGPSLHRAVAEHGPLPLDTVSRLMGAVGEGLASVHLAGLIHRDLKPANVLLAEDGPRVIDFGIAHAADATTLTKVGVGLGTPAFMAPEQVRGVAVTPATDVFALGHLAFYAAAGHTAFGEGHVSAIVHRIGYEQPDLTDCPDQLRGLVEACLQKDPDDRPQMSEIVEQARALYPSDRLSWLPPALAAALAGYDTTTVFTPRQGGWAGRGHGQGQGQGAAVAAAPTAPAAAAAGPGAASATTAPLKEDAPRYTPMQAPPRPYQNPAAWPGAAGGPGAGYGPASPMPYQPPYPLRQRGNRKLVPALIGGGVLLVVLILLLTHAFSNANNSNNAGNDAPLGSTSASASSGQQLGASGSPAPTNAATNLAAGFSSEYSNTQFTMPGESCTQDGYSDESFTPSSVLFTQSGPQVSTNGGNADISLNCNDDSGTGVTDIAPDNIEIAQVTGTPSASACYSAVQREPIAGDIRYTDLHGGMEFCLVGGENNDQLVFLKLDGTDGGTFDLAWTATGWALPSDNS